MEDNRRIHFSSYSLNIYQFEEKTHSGCLNWVIVKQQRVQWMIINKPSCHVHLLFVFASPLPHYSKIYLICNLSASSTFFSPFPSPPKLTEHITGSPKIAVLQSQFIFFFLSVFLFLPPSLPAFLFSVLPREGKWLTGEEALSARSSAGSRRAALCHRGWAAEAFMIVALWPRTSGARVKMNEWSLLTGGCGQRGHHLPVGLWSVWQGRMHERQVGEKSLRQMDG